MITFNELLKRAKTEKVAVHTSSESQAKELLSELDKKGYVWLDESKLTTSTCYGVYKENTCYVINKFLFCLLSHYQKERNIVIEFTDIDFAETIEISKKEYEQLKRISDDVIILNNQDRDNLIKYLAAPPEANEKLKVLFKGEK